jgi:hypothetical protein
MSPEGLKKYFMLRLDGNNNGTDNSWGAGINSKLLNYDEVRMIKKLLPNDKIEVKRFPLDDSHSLFLAIYSDPSIINKPEVKEKLNSLTRYNITVLINEYPNLTKYLVRLDNFNDIQDWQIAEILEKVPQIYKEILKNIPKERKQELLDRLKHTNLLPLLIRDKYISIDTEEEYRVVRYVLLYDTKSKAFVYNPDLLKFVNSSYDLEKILIQQPTVFKHLGDKIKSITDYDLKEIIVTNPKALKYIPEERIDEMGEYRIYNMIYGKPILARQLYNKIGMNYTIDLIKYVPKVIQYLPDSVFRQLDKYDMVNILYKKELYPYMEPIIDKYMPDDKDFILDRI